MIGIGNRACGVAPETLPGIRRRQLREEKGPDEPALESKPHRPEGRGRLVEEALTPATAYFGTSPGSDLTL
jgi:hypothetical protein